MARVLLTSLMVLSAPARAEPPPRPETVRDPTVLPAVAARCADGRDGWHAPDESRGEAVMAALQAFRWRQRGYLAPLWGCHAELQLRCAPDLDGDERPDLLARLRWRRAAKGECRDSAADPALRRYEVAAIVVLRGESGGVPAVLDLISYGDPQPDGSTPAPLTFVQLPSGRVGVRGESPSDPLGGCDLGGLWVGAVVGDRFVQLPSGPALAEPCP